jgi:hypothetical protein
VKALTSHVTIILQSNKEIPSGAKAHNSMMHAIVDNLLFSWPNSTKFFFGGG